MNTGKMTCTALAGVLFGVLPAMAEVTWSLDNEAGTVEGEGSYDFTASQSLTGMVVRATGDGVTLTGKGLVFTGTDPDVSLCGTTVLDLTLSATDGCLSFVHSGGYDSRTYGSLGSYTGFLDLNAYTEVFQGMVLSDFYPVSGLTAGGAITDDKSWTPFHVQRGEDADGSKWLTCQFQVKDNQTKCLKVEFRQAGNDVQAKVLYSRYRASTADFGTDFDEGSSSGGSVATGKTVHGYGIYSVTFARGADMAHLTLNEKVEAASLAIGENVTAVADPGSVLAGSGTTPPAMRIDGSLAITNVLNLDIANGLSGTGDLYLGGYSGAVLSKTAQAVFDTPMPTEWTTVMYGGVLSSVTNVYINEFAGDAISNDSKPGWIYHLKRSTTTLTGQCQVDTGSWIKCVYLEFRQVSTNIEARIKNACYCHNSLGLGVDFDTLAWTTDTPRSGVAERKSYVTSSVSGAGGYGIGSFTLFLDVDTPQNLSPLVDISLSGENTMSGGKINQRGGTVRVLSTDALSSGGGVYTVSGEGTLILVAPGCELGKSVGDGKTELRATGGSTIISEDNLQLDYSDQNVYLDCGILCFASTNGNSKNYPAYDSGEFLNHVTLADGSRINGLYPRVGYDTVSPVWKVTGTSSSFLDTGLFTYSTTDQLCTFDVEDVTGDDEADFTVNGPILPNGPISSGAATMHLRKAGPGTMRLNGRVRSQTPLCIDEGTLELGASDILCGTHTTVIPAITTGHVPIQFGGGTLAGAAGTSNVVGYVTLTNDSQIVVGEGAVFTFPDCSGQEWVSGMKLSITGEIAANSVRFGTSREALTGRQRAALRLNGERAMLDDQGYVRQDSGLVITVR